MDIGLWDNVEASGGEGLPVGTRVTVRSPAEGSVIGRYPTCEAGPRIFH